MKPLSNAHSKILFFKRIFGTEDCYLDMLKEVSNSILKKCGGLPLAIISISGLLANKPRVKEEWEKVKWSIGTDLNKRQSLEGMKIILSLSYNDLPPNLKTCLLYLCIFPEDYVIDRERLVRRWIAEGFISEERGQSHQEVAENYFYELINKSMVQPVDIGCDGKVRACRLHDMMLELIISKSIEENFITIVSGRQTVWENSQCFIRRLSIQHIDQELAHELSKKDLSHVRSLTVTSPSCIKHLPGLVEFESLRVLDLQDCLEIDEYLTNGMEKLFQLKYLSLRNTDLSSVPSGITVLHDLQTLDLRDTKIKELPPGIVQLIKLKHLLMGNKGLTEMEIPAGIGNMKNLQEIAGCFTITKSSVSALQELGNLICSYKLQTVCICGSNSDLFELIDSWSPPPSGLQKFEMTMDYYLSRLPSWIAPALLTSLAYLDIKLSEVTEEDLRVLGELPALLSLGLRTKRVQKDKLILRRGAFRCLKELFVLGVDAGTSLFEEGALPMLEKLDLSFFVSVAKGDGFFLGIEHLPCLNFFNVRFKYKWATCPESKAAAVAIRNEVSLHPNHPRVILYMETSENVVMAFDVLSLDTSSIWWC